jgi:cell division protein FtsZ
MRKKKPQKIKKKVLSRSTPKESESALPEAEKVKKTKIRVVGIGGGGGNIVSELILRVEKATFVVANTDRQVLKEASRKALKLQFGENFTHGLGTGMNQELGEQAALEAKDKIKNLLKGQDLVILISTLGGGAGSGAAPIFAKISKNLGSITYGIFTLPFKFEGEKKIEIAREAFEKLRPHLNGVSVIPNELIFKIIEKETPLTKALSAINKNLADNLEGLIETIYQPGLINIDFADFKTIFSGRGRLTYLNTVEVEKEKGIEEVIKKLNFSPLYPYTIRGAKGILFNITGGKDLSLAEVSQISKNIFSTVNKEAKIIFGISQNQKETDKIKVNLLANGCQTRIFPSESKKIKVKTVPKKIRRKKRKRKPKLLKIKRRPKSPKKKRKKSKTKKPSAKIKKEKKFQSKETEKNINSASLPLPEEKIEIKVRRNALQVKEADKEAEKEIVEKEKFWEPPAFLRKRKFF